METHIAVPQADDLDKIFSVVDIISDGTDDALSIAERLGVVARQGHYYLTAAEQLGLVHRGALTGRWSLTTKGLHYRLVSEKAHERERIVMQSPIIKHLANLLGVKRPKSPNHVHLFEDEKFVADAIEEMGYAPETAYRRALTIKAWMKGLAV